MDAIAAAAAVSKQTVYSHFKSKDELFRACVADKVEKYSLDPSRLPQTDDLDVFLRHVGKQYLTLLSDIGVIRMFRLMAAEVETHPDAARSFHESGPITTAHNIAEILARHLPAKATYEFLSLLRGEYFLELILGIRDGIPDAEINAHTHHCIAQLHKLYDFG